LKQKPKNISAVYFEEVRKHLGTDAPLKPLRFNQFKKVGAD
jgi:hypothetical protein